MILQTRENDIAMFAEIARIEQIESPEQIPLRVLIPAFLTSELRSAFITGFFNFSIPFVVIDLMLRVF